MITTKRLALSIAVLALVSTWTAPAGAQLSDPTIGEAAPAFTLADTYGNEHALESYRGKWVVLEWLNYGCPYVGKHYNSKRSIETRTWCGFPSSRLHRASRVITSLTR